MASSRVRGCLRARLQHGYRPASFCARRPIRRSWRHDPSSAVFLRDDNRDVRKLAVVALIFGMVLAGCSSSHPNAQAQALAETCNIFSSHYANEQIEMAAIWGQRSGDSALEREAALLQIDLKNPNEDDVFAGIEVLKMTERCIQLGALPKSDLPTTPYLRQLWIGVRRQYTAHRANLLGPSHRLSSTPRTARGSVGRGNVQLAQHNADHHAQGRKAVDDSDGSVYR